ncbi:MAG: hypothetical protein AB2693_32125 [Candidatus Thiodiazotropha sp.]
MTVSNLEKRNEEDAASNEMEDLNDIWSEQSDVPSTIECEPGKGATDSGPNHHVTKTGKGVRQDVTDRTVRQDAHGTSKNNRRRNASKDRKDITECPAATVLCDITGSPIASSSGPSLIPPTPGMQRAMGLIHRMRSRQQKDPSVKEVIAPTASCRPYALSHPGTLQNAQTKDNNKSKSLKKSASITKRKSTELDCIQEPVTKKQKTTQKETSDVKKVRKIYPCHLCGVLRDRLDKHYKNAHKMTSDAAKARYRIQKSIADGGKRVSSCAECGKVVAHLSQHLSNMHGIERKSETSVKIRQDARMLSVDDQLALVMPKKSVDTSKSKMPVYTGIAIINDFIKWLPTMRGKKTTEKSAKQHRSQATKIWQKLSPEELNGPQPLQLKDITSEGILEFVEYQRLKMIPGTLKSYLCSFGFFLEFLNSTSCKQIELDKDTLDILHKEVHNYNSNLRGDVAQRKAEFALQEHEDLLPASVIHHFLESHYLQQIEDKIIKGEVFNSLNEYCAVRDALMAMIVCTNAQRTSAIRDIRPNNVFKAKLEDDMKVIGVACHKTSASRGVANISLTDNQYLMMKQFALQTSQVGEKYNRGDNSPMFVTYVGNQMSASNAAKSIRQSLEKSGALALVNQDDPKFTPTMVRKLITTLVREEEPELAGPLAQQLNHSTATAEGTYQLKMKQQTSAKVVKMIGATITTAARKETDTVISETTDLGESQGSITLPTSDRETSETTGLAEIQGAITSQTSSATNTGKHLPSVTSDSEENKKTEIFNFPTQSEFVTRMMTFTKSEVTDRILSDAFKLTNERMTDPISSMLEGRRYKLIQKFEEAVEKKYEIQLSTAFTPLVPKVSFEADLQSDVVILFASEFANTFCNTPRNLSARDQIDWIPLSELEEILSTDKEQQGISNATNEHDSQQGRDSVSQHHGEKVTQSQQHDTSVHQLQQNGDSVHQPQLHADSGNQLQHGTAKKTFWTKEDTILLEKVFQGDLQRSIAERKRVSKKVMRSKLALNPELESLVSTYGKRSIYEKLYSLARPKFLANN